MTRVVYRWLLWLHPPAFRREFASEMLLIFEEGAEAEGAATLLADGLVSLMRQWLLGSGSWKVAAAIVGGLLEVAAGGFGMLIFGHGRIMAHLASARLQEPPNPAEALALYSLMRLAIWAVTGVVVMVVVLVFWVKSLNGRRIHRLSVCPEIAVLGR